MLSQCCPLNVEQGKIHVRTGRVGTRLNSRCHNNNRRVIKLSKNNEQLHAGGMVM